MQAENDKQRSKIKSLANEVAELESSLNSTQSAKKLLQSNYDELEDDRD